MSGAGRKRCFSKVGCQDYGARFYDPSLARFHTMDPLSKQYSFQSPFVYAANNPILYIDWLGLAPVNNLAPKRYEDGIVDFLDLVNNWAYEPRKERIDWWEEYQRQKDERPGGVKVIAGEALKGDEKDKKSDVEDVPANGGGDWHPPMALNEVGNAASYASGAIGLIQIGMLEHSLQFSSTYGLLGTTRRVLGGASTYVGAPLSISLDFIDMQNNKISGGRFAYRTTGTLSSIGVTAVIGSIYGGPFGAVGGTIIVTGFVAGEYIYDGAKYILNETSRQISNIENAINSGTWYPGR